MLNTILIKPQDCTSSRVDVVEEVQYDVTQIKQKSKTDVLLLDVI